MDWATQKKSNEGVSPVVSVLSVSLRGSVFAWEAPWSFLGGTGSPELETKKFGIVAASDLDVSKRPRSFPMVNMDYSW
jgi:hypothetical protein